MSVTHGHNLAPNNTLYQERLKAFTRKKADPTGRFASADEVDCAGQEKNAAQKSNHAAPLPGVAKKTAAKAEAKPRLEISKSQRDRS